jgi:hypothetical protein
MDDNMTFHYHFELNPEKEGNRRIIGIDLEWAKNWSKDEKVFPFSFASHTIYLPFKSDPCIGNFKMHADILFRGFEEATTEFLSKIDEFIGKEVLKNNTVIVGHQISSDIWCMLNSSKKVLPNVQTIAEKFNIRRTNSRNLSNPSLFNFKTRQIDFKVFDTRYDISSRVRGQERLRDVSLRLGVYAIQFELSPKLSLTKLYRLFIETKEREKMEKLIILNWRHAFQTALVYLVDQICPSLTCYSNSCKRRILTTNDIIYKMASKEIAYLNTEEYRFTMRDEGIQKYLSLYPVKKNNSNNVKKST